MMIQVYRFHPVWRLPSASPFCVKLEAYLRMAGIAYQPVDVGDPRHAPRGKLPYIDEDGRVIPDSGAIVAHLELTRDAPLDGWLAPDQRARAHALRRMIEESLYFALLYSRWIDHDGWAAMRQEYFGRVRAPARWIIAPLARRMVAVELKGQGYGRHPRDEIYGLGCDDIDALSVSLGDKPFLLGEKPCSLDAAAYGMLAHIYLVPVPTPLSHHARQRPNLDAYVTRIRDAWFSEEAYQPRPR